MTIDFILLVVFWEQRFGCPFHSVRCMSDIFVYITYTAQARSLKMYMIYELLSSPIVQMAFDDLDLVSDTRSVET